MTKVKIATEKIIENFEIACIIILFIWISFYPMPMPQNVRIGLYLFLTIPFLTTVWKRGISIFKKSDWPLWLFLIAIGLNVPFAQQKQIAFRTYLDLVIPMFLIYYIVSEGVTSNEKFLLFAKVICITSSLVALLGVLDCLSGSNFIYENFIPNPFYQRYKIRECMRAISTQFHNPPLGSYLIASLPFNLLLTRQNKLVSKLLGYLGSILIVIAIILTFSRGVFLGFVAMVLFILYTNKRYRLTLIFFIFCCIFVFICSQFPYLFKIFGLNKLLFSPSGIFSSFRADKFFTAFKMLKDHPLTGLGFQHFRIMFYDYAPNKGMVAYEFRIADNMYLTLLAETGILGFLGFLTLIFSIFIKARSKIKIFKNSLQQHQQSLMVLSAIIGLLVNMGGYELFYWPNQYLYFCLLIGLVESYWRNVFKVEH